MYSKKRWDIYFRQHGCPCVIIQLNTKKILYCNDKFLKLFDIKNDILGENFYDIVDMDTLEMEKMLPDWKKHEYFECETYHKNTDMRFHLRAIASIDDDTVFAEVIPIDDIREYKFDEAMTECLSILQLPNDEVIPSLMKLLCKFYNAHSTYLNRIDFANNKIQCEYDLSSNHQFQREIDDKVVKHTDKILQWFEKRNEMGVLEADINKEEENSIAREILDIFSMNNITSQIIEDLNGNPAFIIGLNNREEGFLDYRILTTIAKFIGQGLGKFDMENAISNLKNIDDLTGFSSRSNYSERVHDIMKNSPKTIGIIFVNVNGLKNINENLGYTYGDKHIKIAAQKLKQHFDYDFYRVSGDEFIGIVENTTQAELEEKSTQLQKSMRESGDDNFALGYAFGQGGYDFTKLVTQAETTMYINKQEYYASSNRNFDDVSDSVLADLLTFLENDEFMIYLQPQVHLSDGSLYGAEALIRRYDKTNQKMVFPDQFIPFYEQKSLIRHIDMFVIETVCQLLSNWCKDGKAIPISVNLSRVTLQEYGIVNSIVEVCDKYSVPHNLVVIEVTERVGLIENNVASSLIKNFKDHGFNISLDDFGCAYSNIVTLAQIEVDEVKIDKSLVDDLTTSKKNHILVKNVLSMCNELDGASTLAEGIEDEEQAKLLSELGCHLGQGYYYSRPVPVDEFISKYI